MHSIRTNISVIETREFKFFLEANDMKDVNVGSYDIRRNNFQLEHFICYAYTDTNEDIVSNLTYITLKHGSLENAFRHYRNTLREISAGTVYGNII